MENVSVVIPSYKSEKLISRTILSIINTGVLSNNIFVIEDGVFDNTVDVLKTLTGINHISYKKNKGAPYARNLGLSKVKTKYVMFIDSDDFVSQSLISGLVESAEKDNADITFGPWRLDGDSIPQGKLRQPPNLTADDWVLHWINKECVPTCSVLWKTEKVREIGGWNEKLKKNQDGEIAVRGLINTNNLSISTQGYSTYWQHNSEIRVSNANIKDRLYASDLVYNHIFNWINKYKKLSKYRAKLGRYCCKVAWHAQSENEESLSYIWLERARDLGYTSKGYNRKTTFISNLFGFRYAVIIYPKILMLLK